MTMKMGEQSIYYYEQQSDSRHFFDDGAGRDTKMYKNSNTTWYCFDLDEDGMSRFFFNDSKSLNWTFR